MRPIIASALFASGCFQVHTTWECEEVARTDVGDDEVTEQGTATALLDAVAYDGSLPGRLGNGVATTVHLLVARAPDATAQFVERVPWEDRHRTFGVGSFPAKGGPACASELRVPLVVDVATDVGGLAVTVPAQGQSWFGVDVLPEARDWGTAQVAQGAPLPDPGEAAHTYVRLAPAATYGVWSGAVGWSQEVNGQRRVEELVTFEGAAP